MAENENRNNPYSLGTVLTTGGLVGAGQAVSSFGDYAEQLDKSMDKWRAGTDEARGVLEKYTNPVVEKNMANWRSVYEKDPGGYGPGKKALTAVPYKAGTKRELYTPEEAVNNEMAKTIAHNVPDDELSRALRLYETSGGDLARTKWHGAPIPRWVMGAYHKLPLENLRQLAWDSPHKQGLGGRLLSMVTAPIREATVPVTDFDRELNKVIRDHYMSFESGNRNAILKHWLHKMQRDVERPAFIGPRELWEHYSNDTFTPEARAVLEDTTTSSENVLQRLKALGGQRNKEIYGNTKIALSDIISQFAAPKGELAPPGPAVYGQKAKPILQALMKMRRPGRAASIVAPMAYLGFKGFQDASSEMRKTAAEEGYGAVDAAEDTAALGTSGLSGVLLHKLVKDKGARGFNPYGEVKAVLAPGGGNENLEAIASKGTIGSQHSFGAQLRGAYHGLNDAGLQTDMRHLKYKTQADALRAIKDYDAILQYAPHPTLDTLESRQAAKRKGLTRGFMVSDYGAGGTFNQRGGTGAVMHISEPTLFDIFATPGATPLKDIQATSYRTDAGTMRPINLNGKVTDIGSIPHMALFDTAKFAPEAGGKVRVLMTHGGGSGSHLPFNMDMVRTFGNPLGYDKAWNPTRQEAQQMLDSGPTVIDDTVAALKKKYGNNFELEYAYANPQDRKNLYGEMEARKLAGDPRFANVTFSGDTRNIPREFGLAMREMPSQADMASKFARSNYIFTLPGSTMAEILAMQGKLPKIVGMTPSKESRQGAMHWEGNDLLGKRMVPGYHSLDLSDLENRAKNIDAAIQAGHETLPEWGGYKTEYKGLADTVKRTVAGKRWGNIGKAGLLATGVTAPLAYMYNKHLGGPKTSPSGLVTPGVGAPVSPNPKGAGDLLPTLQNWASKNPAMAGFIGGGIGLAALLALIGLLRGGHER